MSEGTLVGAIWIFRHGQRPPYAPRFAESAAGASIWTTRQMPGPAAWGMRPGAFANQTLAPSGFALLRHLGEYLRANSALGDPCALSTLVVADDEQRDVESATAFVEGFFPPECAGRVVRADSSRPLLRPLANDHFTTCEGVLPGAAEMQDAFGHNFVALTALYEPLIDEVAELIGCCSETLCARYGLQPNCTLSSLPYEWTGEYWTGMYDGPLQAAAYFADAFMLQALSGMDPAWGLLSRRRVRTLHALQERVMALGSHPRIAAAYGSHALACAASQSRQPRMCIPMLAQPLALMPRCA